MKALTLVIALLSIATTAEAAPAVNDAVSFQGSWGSEPIWQHITFTAWNPSTQQFKQVTTTKIGAAAPATQETMVNFKDTASDAAEQYIVNNCGQYNGVNEQIQVPAGSFLTCKMPLQAGGFVWIGVVPFAVVRIETPVQGKTLTAVLTGVNRGI